MFSGFNASICAFRIWVGRLDWMVSCNARTRFGVVSFRLRASATTLALPGWYFIAHS
ncbi:hypothetical protein Hanom_Chr15g01394151 [Helianthus anomalus]